ncbi:sensor histidine kinase [Aliikangiella sp. G2MR2-5]|uniref:sensor histidine kinase n=1 Tax=Aliikangiella sp. G2MR2-5 TaxID=2788943 RepID=UPI0018AC4667|nr:histidine kinase [Aliikangiella sp. G2MR2-5]
MNYETRRSEIATDEAKRLNKELEATQTLLTEATRQNERTRIARELHDLLGHHLTALIINLQVAGRMTDGEAKSKVEQCHALAKLLLSDVREAVSALRENQQLDFDKMLKAMCDSLPGLTVHRQIRYQFNLEQMNIAKALFSVIQEALTNSLRHANATEFWVDLKQNKPSNLVLELYDNGSAGVDIKQGNGLTGMRERIQELNGCMHINRLKNALKISIEIPLANASPMYSRGV